MPMINPAIRQNRSLFIGGVMQLIYGLIELTDSATIVLITAGLVPNIYLGSISGSTEIAAMLENLPIIFIPIFWFFTGFRLLSAYWILQNKEKGFWTALFVSGVTIVAAFFLLPSSVIDLVAVGLVIAFLFNGYFEDKPLVST